MAHDELRQLLLLGDIDNLKSQLSSPDQFRINFDYLARRARRRGI